MIFKVILMELKKVFKRKSIYVIWGLMLIFCFFNNFLYWRDYDDEGRYLYEEQDNLKEEMQKLEEELKRSVNEENVDIESQIELLKLKEEFSPHSWQYLKISDYLYHAAYEKNSDPGNLEKEKEYQTKVLKLKEGDYSYFFTLEKKRIEEEILELEDMIKENSSALELSLALKEKKRELSVMNYRIQNKIVEDNGYLNKALLSYLKARETLEEKEKNTYQDKNWVREWKKEMKVNAVILKDRVNYSKENTLCSLIKGIMDDYEIFFVVIVVMVSAFMICDEFQKGTVKFLLIKPVSRFIILLGKYFTALLVFLFSVLLVFLVQLILGEIFFGIGNLNVIVYDYTMEKVLYFHVFHYFFLYFFSKVPIYLMITLICNMISVVSSSLIASVVIPLMVYLFSTPMLEFSISHKLYFMKYLPNFTWRFSELLFGASSKLDGLSFRFSLIFYSLSFFLFFVVLVILFKRKDIQNV